MTLGIEGAGLWIYIDPYSSYFEGLSSFLELSLETYGMVYGSSNIFVCSFCDKSSCSISLFVLFALIFVINGLLANSVAENVLLNNYYFFFLKFGISSGVETVLLRLVLSSSYYVN